MAEFRRVRLVTRSFVIIVDRTFVSSMAKEYGLDLKYKEEFHGMFEEHQEHPEFGPLMVRMNVVDANGESSMDEDQWEAASELLVATRSGRY